MENIELTNNGIPTLFDSNMCESIEKTGITIQVSTVNAQIPNSNGMKVYKCSINDYKYKTNALFIHNEGQEINNFDIITVYKTNIKHTQMRSSILIVKKYVVIERPANAIIQYQLENYSTDNSNNNFHNFQSSNCSSAYIGKSNMYTVQSTNINLNNGIQSSNNKNTHSQISNNNSIKSIPIANSNLKTNNYINNQHNSNNIIDNKINNNNTQYSNINPNYNDLDNNLNNNSNESFYDINLENTKPFTVLKKKKSENKAFYLPLSIITTFTKEILLKVRVTNKSQKKTYSLGRSGSVFSFTIRDEEGSEFPCTGFNRACEKYYDLLEEGKVYEIKGGYVKLNDRKFTNLNSEYKLFLDDKTIIKEIPDDSSIQKLILDFKKLEQLVNLPDFSIVDVMGYVLDTGNPEIIFSKKGDEKKLRKIIICDDSHFKTEVAIWGKNSETNLTEKSVYAFKNAKLKQYQNKKFLNIGDDSSILPLNNEEALDFKRACEHLAQSEFQEIIVAAPEKELGLASPAAPSNLKKIKDLIEALNINSDEAISKLGLFWVKAVVCGLTLNIDKLYYAGCPHCKKKVVVPNQIPNQNGNGNSNGNNNKQGCVCDSCKKAFEKHVLYYTLNLKIKDLTGELHIDVIGKEGEKVLLGKTAEEFKEAVEQHDEDELRRIASEADYLQYYFLLLPKINFYNDVKRKRFSVVRIDPVATVAETHRMMNDLMKIANF